MPDEDAALDTSFCARFAIFSSTLDSSSNPFSTLPIMFLKKDGDDDAPLEVGGDGLRTFV